MSTWTRRPDERFALYWPIGLRLIDDLTGERPRGRVVATLWRDDAGTIVETEIAAQLTPSGVLTYPALGRRADPVGRPARRYQVRIDADLYRPLYRAVAIGIDFDASPYDDQTPPAAVPTDAVETRLLPSPRYPFPGQLAVLRGAVTVDGAPTADVLVSYSGAVAGTPVADRTLSVEDGEYALPLRWVPHGTPVQIDAAFTPPGGAARAGAITITLPDALAVSQVIAIA